MEAEPRQTWIGGTSQVGVPWCYMGIECIPTKKKKTKNKMTQGISNDYQKVVILNTKNTY